MATEKFTTDSFAEFSEELERKKKFDTLGAQATSNDIGLPLSNTVPVKPAIQPETPEPFTVSPQLQNKIKQIQEQGYDPDALKIGLTGGTNIDRTRIATGFDMDRGARLPILNEGTASIAKQGFGYRPDHGWFEPHPVAQRWVDQMEPGWKQSLAQAAAQLTSPGDVLITAGTVGFGGAATAGLRAGASALTSRVFAQNISNPIVRRSIQTGLQGSSLFMRGVANVIEPFAATNGGFKSIAKALSLELGVGFGAELGFQETLKFLQNKGSFTIPFPSGLRGGGKLTIDTDGERAAVAFVAAFIAGGGSFAALKAGGSLSQSSKGFAEDLFGSNSRKTLKQIDEFALDNQAKPPSLIREEQGISFKDFTPNENYEKYMSDSEYFDPSFDELEEVFIRLPEDIALMTDSQGVIHIPSSVTKSGQDVGVIISKTLDELKKLKGKKTDTIIKVNLASQESLKGFRAISIRGGLGGDKFDLLKKFNLPKTFDGYFVPRKNAKDRLVFHPDDVQILGEYADDVLKNKTISDFRGRSLLNLLQEDFKSLFRRKEILKNRRSDLAERAILDDPVGNAKLRQQVINEKLYDYFDGTDFDEEIDKLINTYRENNLFTVREQTIAQAAEGTSIEGGFAQPEFYGELPPLNNDDILKALYRSVDEPDFDYATYTEFLRDSDIPNYNQNINTRYTYHEPEILYSNGQIYGDINLETPKVYKVKNLSDYVKISSELLGLPKKEAKFVYDTLQPLVSYFAKGLGLTETNFMNITLRDVVDSTYLPTRLADNTSGQTFGATAEFNVTGDNLANSYLIQGPEVEKYIDPVSKSIDIYYKNDNTTGIKSQEQIDFEKHSRVIKDQANEIQTQNPVEYPSDGNISNFVDQRAILDDTFQNMMHYIEYFSPPKNEGATRAEEIKHSTDTIIHEFSHVILPNLMQFLPQKEFDELRNIIIARMWDNRYKDMKIEYENYKQKVETGTIPDAQITEQQAMQKFHEVFAEEVAKYNFRDLSQINAKNFAKGEVVQRIGNDTVTYKLNFQNDTIVLPTQKNNEKYRNRMYVFADLHEAFAEVFSSWAMHKLKNRTFISGLDNVFNMVSNVYSKVFGRSAEQYEIFNRFSSGEFYERFTETPNDVQIDINPLANKENQLAGTAIKMRSARNMFDRLANGQLGSREYEITFPGKAKDLQDFISSGTSKAFGLSFRTGGLKLGDDEAFGLLYTTLDEGRANRFIIQQYPDSVEPKLKEISGEGLQEGFVPREVLENSGGYAPLVPDVIKDISNLSKPVKDKLEQIVLSGAKDIIGPDATKSLSYVTMRDLITQGNLREQFRDVSIFTRDLFENHNKKFLGYTRISPVGDREYLSTLQSFDFNKLFREELPADNIANFKKSTLRRPTPTLFDQLQLTDNPQMVGKYSTAKLTNELISLQNTDGIYRLNFFENLNDINFIRNVNPLDYDNPEAIENLLSVAQHAINNNQNVLDVLKNDFVTLQNDLKLNTLPVQESLADPRSITAVNLTDIQRQKLLDSAFKNQDKSDSVYFHTGLQTDYVDPLISPNIAVGYGNWKQVNGPGFYLTDNVNSSKTYNLDANNRNPLLGDVEDESFVNVDNFIQAKNITIPDSRVLKLEAFGLEDTNGTRFFNNTFENYEEQIPTLTTQAASLFDESLDEISQMFGFSEYYNPNSSTSLHTFITSQQGEKAADTLLTPIINNTSQDSVHAKGLLNAGLQDKSINKHLDVNHVWSTVTHLASLISTMKASSRIAESTTDNLLKSRSLALNNKLTNIYKDNIQQLFYGPKNSRTDYKDYVRKNDYANEIVYNDIRNETVPSFSAIDKFYEVANRENWWEFLYSMKPALWNVIKGVSGNANYKNLSDNLIKINNIPDKNTASLELLKNYTNNQLLFDTKENILISNYLPDISSANINKPNLIRAYKELQGLYNQSNIDALTYVDGMNTNAAGRTVSLVGDTNKIKNNYIPFERNGTKTNAEYENFALYKRVSDKTKKQTFEKSDFIPKDNPTNKQLVIYKNVLMAANMMIQKLLQTGKFIASARQLPSTLLTDSAGDRVDLFNKATFGLFDGRSKPGDNLKVSNQSYSPPGMARNRVMGRSRTLESILRSKDKSIITAKGEITPKARWLIAADVIQNKLPQAIEEAFKLIRIRELKIKQKKSQKVAIGRKGFENAWANPDSTLDQKILQSTEALFGALKGRDVTEGFETLNLDAEEFKSLIFVIQSTLTDKSIRGSYFDVINAQSGMEQMAGRNALGHIEGFGTPIQKSQLDAIEKIFGLDTAEIISRRQKQKTPLEKLLRYTLEVFNLRRVLKLAGDLSGMLIQGLLAVPTYPAQYVKASASMFKNMWTEKTFIKFQQSIKEDPLYSQATSSKEFQGHGLAISNPEDSLTQREEFFITNLLKKIPLLGYTYAVSERAYVILLNKLRFEIYKKHHDLVKDLPDDVYHAKMRNLSGYINSLTGRGPLHKILDNGVMVSVLNTIFLAPRFFSAKLHLPMSWALNNIKNIYRQTQKSKDLKNIPREGLSDVEIATREAYAHGKDLIWKEMNKDLVKIAGFYLTMGYAINAASGYSFNLDWRSSDFAKIKKDNRPIEHDITAGFGSILRYIIRIGVATMSNIDPDKDYYLRTSTGGRYKPELSSAITGLLKSKLNFGTQDLISGITNKNFEGETVDLRTAFVPLDINKMNPGQRDSYFQRAVNNELSEEDIDGLIEGFGYLWLEDLRESFKNEDINGFQSLLLTGESFFGAGITQNPDRNVFATEMFGRSYQELYEFQQDMIDMVYYKQSDFVPSNYTLLTFSLQNDFYNKTNETLALPNRIMSKDEKYSSVIRDYYNMKEEQRGARKIEFGDFKENYESDYEIYPEDPLYNLKQVQQNYYDTIDSINSDNTLTAFKKDKAKEQLLKDLKNNNRKGYNFIVANFYTIPLPELFISDYKNKEFVKQYKEAVVIQAQVMDEQNINKAPILAPEQSLNYQADLREVLSNFGQ